MTALETLTHYPNNFVIARIFENEQGITHIKLTNGCKLIPSADVNSDATVLICQEDLHPGDVLSFETDLSYMAEIYNLRQLIVNGYPVPITIVQPGSLQDTFLAYTP